MEKLRPNEQRAKNAIILIWIVLALDVVNLISSYMQYDLLQTIASGGFVSDEAAAANDTREQICGIAYIIAYLISGITFIMWFRRAYFNLHQRVRYLAYSDGWAAGSWFTPIVNLYLPYQIMKEIYVETKKFLTQKGFSEKVEYSTSYLGWWWALWIISGFVGRFVLKFAFKSADTVDNLIVTTVAQMAVSTLDVLLALITIVVIKDYSNVEPLLPLVPISEEEKTDIAAKSKIAM